MERLPDSLLLQILSRLDDSADVARCRVAWKAFDAVFPELRSIKLLCPLKWYVKSGHCSVSSYKHTNKPFKSVFLDLISKQKVVESVCIGYRNPIIYSMVYLENEKANDLCLTDVEFVMEWLPRVSHSLKFLSISLSQYHSPRRSDVLLLISKYCHNLVGLELKDTWVHVDNLNPMPMLTSLTLAYTEIEDQHLNQFNKCFPNLQALNMMGVGGLTDPKIHLLNLKTCYLVVSDHPPYSLTLITPNLITLDIQCVLSISIHVDAPMLSHFHLSQYAVLHQRTFTAKKFENLETLWLSSFDIASLVLEFPITKTVENLTLDSGNEAPRDARDSRLTLGKVFTVFPNLSSLCIRSSVWSELEACVNPEGWEILNGRKGLKTISAHLMLDDPSLTFSFVACVLDQCEGLSDVSLLIHCDVVRTQCKSFMSKCCARWPGLKWRWGTWGEDMEDSWIPDATEHHKSSKKLRL